MGSSGAKLAHKATEPGSTQETGSIPSTPILTPKVFRENIEKECCDPRSPSKHIARTPIELLSATVDKLATPTIETGNSDNLSIETPLKRHLILGIDPRSPTLEVQRTPIVVNAISDDKLPAKIRNKYLDKVKNSSLINSPKLLDSSPITPKIKADVYKRKSLVLLETNIDFTETDLDTVIKEKYLGKSLQNLCKLEEASYCEVLDPRSPAIDFLRTPIQICKKAEAVPEGLDSENVELIKEHLVQNVDSSNVIIEKHSGEESVNVEDLASVSNESLLSILPLTKEDSPVKNLLPKEILSDKENIERGQCICDQTEEIFKEKTEELMTTKNVDPVEENNLVSKEISSGKENIETREYICDQIALMSNEETSNEEIGELITTKAFDNLEENDGERGKDLSKDDLQAECDDKVEAIVDLALLKRLSPKSLREKVPSSTISQDKLQLVPKSAPVSPPSIVSVTPKKTKSQPVTPPLIDLTADVKELDKKLTNLIYEDEDLVVCPRVIKIKDQTRTPLGLRNGTDNRKCTHKLKVSDKPRKAEYAVSKIPIFKEKKVKVQCENTPPREMRGGKSKKSQWDSKDDTLLI